MWKDDAHVQFLIRYLTLDEVAAHVVARHDVRAMAGAPVDGDTIPAPPPTVEPGTTE